MSLRVDLLKKNERRYQGIVSMKVMVLGSVGVLLGTSLLVLALALISQATQSSNYKRAKKSWEDIKPTVAVIKENGVAAEANRKTLERIDAWTKGGSVPMYKILREVQKEIPAEIQLQSMRAGILEGESEDQESYYILRISGLAIGALLPVDAKLKFNSNENITGFCGDVRLISSDPVGEDMRSFAIEGRRAQEEAK